MRAKQDEEARRLRTLHVILAVLGVFLIAGGILKLAASGLGTPQADFTTVISVVFSIVEILGGAWMVAGYGPERTRGWALAAFVGLWATSAFQAVTGKCSCGCFGSVAVSPWLVMLFDLAAVVILLKWDATGRANADLVSTPRRALDLAAAALAMIVLGHFTQAPLSVAGAATLGGRPLEFVELEVRLGSFRSTVQTDDQGNFRLPPVRPGIYAVTLFDRGSHLEPGGNSHASRPSIKAPRKMTLKQKKAFLEAGKKAMETAGIAADAATIWIDLSTCTSTDVKIDYK